MEGFFVIIGVVLGYYLGNRAKINQEVSEKVKKVQKKKGYGNQQKKEHLFSLKQVLLKSKPK